MLNYKNIFILLLISCSFSCKKEKDTFIPISPITPPPTTTETTNNGPNILLIVVDDMGKDWNPGYPSDRTQPKPNMPNLEDLVQNGLTFDNVWATPLCSPTRATILTGKYGLQTKVTAADDKISLTEIPIHQIVKEKGYTNGLIGKWHLTGDNPSLNDPARMGIDYYAGFLNGQTKAYNNWNLTENGRTSTSNEYITTKLTDLAIDWIDKQSTPWFLWMAYTAPHAPFHLPPDSLHNQGSLPSDEASINANPAPYYLATLEALDFELGRLIAAISPGGKKNAMIIFISDNGTPLAVSQYPGRNGNETLHQNNINVPMIISGSGQNRKGQRTAELINSTDLFATIADIAGSNKGTTDSRSFKSLLLNEEFQQRDYVYSELSFIQGESWAIRDKQYKLIESSNGQQELYDLFADPFELYDLLKEPLSAEVGASKVALEVRAQQIRLQ